MGVLHLVNKAAAFEDCMALMAPGDALLLIEDGVYAARRRPAAPVDDAAGAGAGEAEPPALPDACYALDADLEARGLLGRMDSRFQAVSYHGFVDLVEKHRPIVTWSR